MAMKEAKTGTALLEELRSALTAPDAVFERAVQALADLEQRERDLQAQLRAMRNVNYQTVRERRAHEDTVILIEELWPQIKTAKDRVVAEARRMWSERRPLRERTLATLIVELDDRLDAAASCNNDVRLAMEIIHASTPMPIRGPHFAAAGPGEVPFWYELLRKLDGWRVYVAREYGAKVKGYR